ncbi:hypothetical protein LJC27_04790 [Christensenellaceae bacterium OttesenSCG-928-M15]|nr:hypothetical protein [Christensenellaceae bacterium OttesenSCG-928-M15]
MTIAKPDGGRVAFFNHVAYFAGHVSSMPFESFQEQLEAILQRYDGLFLQYGLQKKNILMMFAYLKDIADMAVFEEIFRPWHGGDAPPGVAVQAQCMGPDRLIEISFIVAQEEQEERK